MTPTLAEHARTESWAGEVRVNMIRIAALLLFYARHLIEFATAAAGAPVRGAYHVRVTVLCLTWAIAAFALHYFLVRRFVPWWLKFAAMLFDAAMITALCINTGDGRTPLILLLFVLVATAPLRLSLGLVYAATACSILAYLTQLATYAWKVVGYRKYYATPELRIPRSHEAIVILALLACGFLAGQSVRQARRMFMRGSGEARS